MKPPFPSFSRPRIRSASRGVALVVTLMMMSVLVMMVVGLAGVMRNEQAAARNLTYQVLAEQMAELGARQAMAVVLSNSAGAVGRPTATGPGWMVTNGVSVALYSSNNGAAVKNLDAMGTNSMILSLPTTAGLTGTVLASWSNVVPPGSGTVAVGRFAWWVDDEGSKVNLNAVGSNNTNLYLPLLTNFPISADMIFVDPVTLKTNAASSSRAGALQRRSNSLPTTESLKDTNAVNPSGGNSIGGDAYRRLKGHVTAWSSNLDLTPWGAAKINLSDPTLTAAQIKAALNTNAWATFFGANKTLARKYGGGALNAGSVGNAGDSVMDQIVDNIRVAAGQPATVLSNPANSGNTDNLRHRNQIPTAPVGLSQTPFLNEVLLSVSSLDTSVGASPSITVTFNFQVEIVNPWSTSLNNYQLEILPRKMRFHIGYNRTPADVTPSLITPAYGTPWADASGADAATGITGSSGCWVGPMMEDSNPWPIGSPITQPVPALNPKTYQAVPVTQTFVCTFASGLNPAPNNMQVDQAYVMIDRIVLKDSNGNAVDWLTLDDFSQDANYGTTNTKWPADLGQLNFSPAYPVARQGTAYVTTKPDVTGGAFAANISLGLAKNDPQVRFPTAVWDPNNRGTFRANGFSAALQAWKRVAGAAATGPGMASSAPPVPTPGAENTGIFNAVAKDGTVTGLPYLWPDPVAAAPTLLNHPHFAPGYRTTNGFKSVAQLGAIHTGLPWRTLRLQPQPAVERAAANGAANSPPDWIVLDVFTATNPAVSLPMINVNGVPYARGGVTTNSDGSVSTRACSSLSLLGTAAQKLSSSATNLAISNGVPLSLTNNTSVFSNLPALGSSLLLALTNPSSSGGWSLNSDWRNARAMTNAFPTNGFILRGELLEVAGWSEDTSTPSTSGEDVIEGRLRSFLDLVTTRSDTFSVWSAGQGLAVITNASGTPIRTNIMGEVRKQTVFQRIPQTNSAGSVTGYQLKVLYTRNHGVE